MESFARKAQRRILGDSSPRVVRKARRFGLNARVRERDDRERARRLGAGRARASGANTPRGPRVGRHFSNSHADLATAAGNLPKWRLADAPRARANARVATRERSRGVGGDPNAGERSRGVVRGRVGTRARVGLRGKRQNIPQKATALSVQAKKLGGKVRDFFQPAQFAKSKCADATHSRVVEEETLERATSVFSVERRPREACSTRASRERRRAPSFLGREEEDARALLTHARDAPRVPLSVHELRASHARGRVRSVRASTRRGVGTPPWEITIPRPSPRLTRPPRPLTAPTPSPPLSRPDAQLSGLVPRRERPARGGSAVGQGAGRRLGRRLRGHALRQLVPAQVRAHAQSRAGEDAQTPTRARPGRLRRRHRPGDARPERPGG